LLSRRDILRLKTRLYSNLFVIFENIWPKVKTLGFRTGSCIGHRSELAMNGWRRGNPLKNYKKEQKEEKRRE
jgi:hypothetical protein